MISPMGLQLDDLSQFFDGLNFDGGDDVRMRQAISDNNNQATRAHRAGVSAMQRPSSPIRDNSGSDRLGN
jgi:hypothetical protein